jgi:hypothetical protein
MKNYDTVTEALADLKSKGYTTDFNIAFDKLIASQNQTTLAPSEFEIVEVHRFEGETDPGDENVVYAVESKKGNIKGVFMSAFGPYSDSVSDDMVKKLSIHKD